MRIGILGLIVGASVIAAADASENFVGGQHHGIESAENSLCTGLMSYWPFDTDANDILGTSHGIINGATLVPSFGVDGCLEFDGINDEVVVANPPVGAFQTISFWAYLDHPSLPTDPFSIGISFSAEVGRWIGWGESTSRLHNETFSWTNHVIFGSVDGFLSPISAGWHHYILIYDASESRYDLFIDGVSVSLGRGIDGSAPVFEDESEIRFGRRVHTYPNYFEGRLDEIGVWNRSLTAGEISVLFNNVASVKTSCSAPTTGTTVITHGFQPGDSPEDWPFHMAEAIRVRVVEGGGGARIFGYNKLTGDLDPCVHPACGPQSSGGETVIVFDWADDSNESGEGFSEAAGESLFAGLVQWSRGASPLVRLDHLHLIGHSRGTVVNSEAAERLIAEGFPPPEQVTALDPHDAGAVEEEQLSWEDYDVNEEHPEYECGDGDPVGAVCAWKTVGYQDNYWRDQDDWPCFLDPDGRPVPGSADMDGSDLDQFCHSDVHFWYFFTIQTTGPHPMTGDSPDGDWFSDAMTCDVSSRTGPLAPLDRTVDGYNFSRLGAGTVRCPDVPDSKVEVKFDFNLREGLVNGDLDKAGSSGGVAGWEFHGGGGTASVAILSDNDLRLDAGEWRSHNRFYIPLGAHAVHFCRRVFDVGNNTLTVQLLQGQAWTIYEETLGGTTDWECFKAPIQEDQRGAVSRLMFVLSDGGGGAEVGIDDVRLVVPLFADDFETGDTSAWSATSP